jgi:hypothetical protein
MFDQAPNALLSSHLAPVEKRKVTANPYVIDRQHASLSGGDSDSWTPERRSYPQPMPSHHFLIHGIMMLG